MYELVGFQSEALRGIVDIKVVSPNTSNIRKVMILLHGKIEPEGKFSIIENLPSELSLQKLCDRYGLIIAIPYMKNRYYITTPDYRVADFVSGELISFLEKRYGLDVKVQLILAGISMGGYGAVLNGSVCDRFTEIISVSGAYIQDDVLIGNPEVWADRLPSTESAKGSYLEYMLPLETLEQSKRRNVKAALELYSAHKDNVKFIFTCGSEDWLFLRNQKFIKQIERKGFCCEFVEIPEGGHDSECFKIGLWKALESVDGRDTDGA